MKENTATFKEEQPLHDTVNLKIFDEEVTVGFPKIGQLIRIEINKQKLSQGRYALLSFSQTAGSNKVLDIIDTFSYLTEIIPNFTTRFAHYLDLTADGDGLITVDKLMEVDGRIVNKFMEPFFRQYAPFYNSYIDRDQDKITISAHWGTEVSL